jgi:hypothetical protein
MSDEIITSMIIIIRTQSRRGNGEKGEEGGENTQFSLQ